MRTRWRCFCWFWESSLLFSITRYWLRHRPAIKYHRRRFPNEKTQYITRKMDSVSHSGNSGGSHHVSADLDGRVLFKGQCILFCRSVVHTQESSVCQLRDGLERRNPGLHDKQHCDHHRNAFYRHYSKLCVLLHGGPFSI